MGYMKIPNLYQDSTMLLFRRCYAAEKIHGTSIRIEWRDGILYLYPGGVFETQFVEALDISVLRDRFARLGVADVTVYGEAYGGKIHRMRETYGDEICFVAFEVQIFGIWLTVPNAEDVAGKLGLDFVAWEEGPADLEWLNEQRDRDSRQAIKLGRGTGHMAEGIVIRPLEEFTNNRGARIVAKHERDDFRETRTRQGGE